jgi:hypothetical protein
VPVRTNLSVCQNSKISTPLRTHRSVRPAARVNGSHLPNNSRACEGAPPELSPAQQSTSPKSSLTGNGTRTCGASWIEPNWFSMQRTIGTGRLKLWTQASAAEVESVVRQGTQTNTNSKSFSICSSLRCCEHLSFQVFVILLVIQHDPHHPARQVAAFSAGEMTVPVHPHS